MKASPAQLAGLLSAAILVPPEMFAKIATGFGLPSEKQTATFAIMQALGLIPGAAPMPLTEIDAAPSRPYQCKIGDDAREVPAPSATAAAEIFAAGHAARYLDGPTQGRVPKHLIVQVSENGGPTALVKVAVKIAITAEAHG